MNIVVLVIRGVIDVFFCFLVFSVEAVVMLCCQDQGVCTHPLSC